MDEQGDGHRQESLGHRESIAVPGMNCLLAAEAAAYPVIESRHILHKDGKILSTETGGNVFKKFGISSKITSIHRMTIDSAIERKAKRGGKKIGEKCGCPVSAVG